MDFDTIMHMSPPVLLSLALNAVGIFLKKSPIPDWLIPFALIAIGAITYPLIADTGDVNPKVHNPVIYLAVIGSLIGGASVGANQALRQFLGRNDDKNPPANTPSPSV